MNIAPRWALLLLLLLTGCHNSMKADPPNIILITLDTTRADALGVFGNPRAKTPVLDALANQGCYFTRAWSQAPITLPSHSSILSGLIPPKHGVRNNSTYRLPAEVKTLPMYLKDAGYETGAFIGSIILLKQYGLNRGFDRYDDEIVHYTADHNKNAIVTRRAEDTLDRAWDWIKERKQPFFAWTHLYDAHWPYDPPRPFKEAWADHPYDGEIAYMDLQIGRLVHRLKASGQWDRTVLIITADHGESFGEHKEQTHGFFCFGATTHVPLIISRPLRPGTRFDHNVENIDIAPTVLAMLGIQPDPAMDGRNLFDTGPRMSYSEAMIPFESFYYAPLKGLKADKFSYYKSSEEVLYNLTDDPGETRNVMADYPTQAARLRREMDRIEALNPPPREEQQLDPVSIELLRSLGYIHDGGTHIPQKSDPWSLPSPLSTIEVYMAWQSIKTYEEKYPFKIIEELSGLLETYPDHILLLKELGRLQALAGDQQNAISNLRHAVELHLEDPRLHTMLALAYSTFGEDQKALDEFTLALELDPDHLASRYNAAVVLMRMGNYETAEENLLLIHKANPKEVLTLNNLAFIALNHHDDLQAASRWIDMAWRVNPKFPLVAGNKKKIDQLKAEAQAH